MIIDYKGRSIQVKFWDGERLAKLWSLDTETEMIGEDHQTPEMIIAQVYDGGDTVYLMGRDKIGDFLELHAGDTMVAQNACFDLAVLSKLLGIDWHKAIESDRIFDIGIMWRLLWLATRGTVGRWSLDYTAKMLLDEDVTKDADDRLCWTMEMADKLEQVSEKRLRYAAYDAIITFECFQAMWGSFKSYKNYMSHRLQLKGSIALDYISKCGMTIDLSRRDTTVKAIQEEMDSLSKNLEEHGWKKGKKGNTEVLQSFLREIENGLTDRKLPRTKTANKVTATGRINGDKISTAAEDLREFAEEHPFVAAYIKFKDLEKLSSFFKNLNKDVIHPRYQLLMETGRTSCGSPNIQNCPRKNGVRDCFIASPGKVMIATDYSGLELATAANEMYEKFGYSTMRDKLMEGADLHRYAASIIYNKKMEDVTKEERQCAKACNFGYLANASPSTFASFAKASYNVILNEEEAANIKKKWMAAYPEMVEQLKDELLDRFDWSDSPFRQEAVALGVFKRIIRGETCNSNGDEYEKNVINWALNHALPYLAPNLVGQEPSESLARKVINYTHTTSTGRKVVNRSYTQVKNCAIQAPASDILKLAIYNVMRAGYEIIAEIHDEVIVQVAENSDIKWHCENINRIMIEAANTICPHVKFSTESTVMRRWNKAAHSSFNADGSCNVWDEGK